FSEEMLTGVRRFTTHAYLTFVSVDADGAPIPVAPLIFETEEDRGKGEEACLRREARLDAKRKLLATPAAGGARARDRSRRCSAPGSGGRRCHRARSRAARRALAG